MKLVRALGGLAVLIVASMAGPELTAQSLTISDASINEPGAGTAPARFDVQLSAPSASTVTVAWATVDGTATAPGDYVAGSGTLTFDPGALSQTIEVAVNADALVESSEDFSVVLSSPVNATIADGTGIGTIGDPPAYVVKDLNPGSRGFPDALTDVDGTLFFIAADGTGDKLWKSDGTAAGTVVVSPTTLLGREMVALNGTAYIAAGVAGSGLGELWKSDGTAAGTVLLHSFATATNFEPHGLVTMGGAVYFTADRSLWRSDGTVAGTVALAPFSSLWSNLTASGSRFFFSADVNGTRSELWRSDGTTVGTSQIDVDPIFQANYPKEMGSLLYFGGLMNYLPRAWRSDGTVAGTFKLADVEWWTEWARHGTRESNGATLVAAAAPLDGDMFFPGAPAGTANGELWKTDGTIAGTALVKDIRTGAEGSAITDLMPVGRTLYFCANDGTSGLELWKSDGTPGGTSLVKDANPGATDGCFPEYTYLTNANGALYLAASDGVHGVELWTSDGTASGTYMVQDVSSSSGSAPVSLTVSGSHLFFAPFYPPVGKELWALPLVLGLSVEDVTVTEGDTGTTTAAFAVRLSAPSTETVTVSYATADGTATAGSDYTATSGVLTFLPGDRVKTVSVDVLGDTTPELREGFSLVLSNPTAARLRDGRGIGTIVDQDAPTVSIADAQVTETNATVVISFTLSLDRPSGSGITVQYATADGTAIAGSDYTAKTGTATFSPGATTATVTVNVLGDTRDEPAETFAVDLFGAVGAAIGDSHGVGTILDDDPTPTLNVNSVALTEGNTGSANMTFTVTLAPVSGQEVSASYATADGTATAGLDYTTTTGTLTFPAGTTSRTFTVPILGDLIDEPNETFTVGLSNLVNALAGTPGTGTITDNDTSGIAIVNATVTEGDASPVDATFNVTLTVPSSQTVTVNFATADQTALAGADYTAATGTVTFPPGSTSQPLPVSVLGDLLDEANETFFVNLSGPTGGATISDNQGLGTITDNDATPTLSINDVTLLEGNSGTTDATFTVTLSAASGRSVTVNRVTANGTATAPTDYTALTSATLTFPAGTTTQQVTVVVNGDTTAEVNETFFVNLSGATNATIADTQGLGTITNDDNPVVSIGNVTVTEGNTGTTNATFTVTLALAGQQIITVAYATADGTAVAPGDYTAGSGTLTFVVGDTSETVVVPVVGDLIDEPNETFTVTLSNPVNATLGTAVGTGTITDNDTSAIAIANAAVTEGDGSAVDASFNVTLSGPSTQTVTVGYVTADQTALAGADYTAATGTVTFPPGTTSQPLLVSVLGDLLDEANETFLVNLSNPTGGATISDAQGLGTINDNDPTPTLSIDDVTVLEGNSGTVDATFTVTLSAASGRAVTVNRVTANGTATAPADYTALPSAALTFPAGTTTQTVTVLVNGDTTGEPSETFFVNLSGATNATIGDAQGLGTITNDDDPVVSIGNVTVTEGNTGTTNASFTVTLSPAGQQIVTVAYATADGTAVAPGDYTAGSGTLTFVVGDTSETVVVPVVGDTLDEPNETFTVTLSNPVNATLGTAVGTGTITDNDTATIAIGNTTVTEGDAAPVNATFNVTLTVPSVQTVTVNYATADQTAQAGADYTAVSGTLTFPSGTTTRPVVVSVLGDWLDEPSETFLVNLSNPSGATISDPQGVGTIIDNDLPGPTLSIADATVTEGNAGTANVTFTVTLSPLSTNTVTVHYATADATATTADGDYLPVSGTLTFAPGVGTGVVTVGVRGDTKNEANETFDVLLSAATYAGITDGTGVGTIANDDPLPSLSINDVSVVEGDSGGTTASFTLTLSAVSGQTVTVPYATADGSATTAGGDYLAASGSLTFDPGTTMRTLVVTVNGDTADEGDEYFTVRLSSPVNALLARSFGIGTILDDDPTTLSIDDVSLLEGHSGTRLATFTIAIPAPSLDTVSVHWATSDLTATAPGDYTAASGTASFSPGVRAQQVAITVVGDTDQEGDETFQVTLTAPVNASISDDIGIATILEDENRMAATALTLTPLGQGVLAAGNTVEAQPSWRNEGSVETSFVTGDVTASNGGTLPDNAASYGVLAVGATGACASQSDCYSLTVGGTRPANHWDVSLSETLSWGGASHQWLLHVGDSFTDVPRTNGFFRFVETLLHKGVTGGCTATTYCPTNSATREQMAVFALVGKEGTSYSPPVCGTTPMFPDVPVTSGFCKWVEELARRGTVSGCGGGNYCPTSAVTREQMPIFVLRTLDPTINPPACGTPVFADVPASSPFCRWIEELARRGVVSGCGGGNYCPTSPVTRQEMAVFISATFGFTLYAP